jgi:phage gpG-like protein
MAGFKLSWSIEGVTQLSRRLEGLSANTKNLTVPFRKSADTLIRTFSRDVFSTQGAAIGEKWKRLSPYTVAQKARQGYPSDTLIRTGKMRRSFTSIVASDQAVVYNTAPYFKYHQSNKPRTKIPRRVMMKLGEIQRQQVVKIFQRYLQEQLTQK